ncbi:MAG: TA system VapC family ribonuclease toxin [Cyanobium sp.]
MPASLIDTCVWLALSFEAHPCHRQTRQALLNTTPDHPWLWCRATQQSFLRLASTPTLLNAYGAATATNRDAFRALQALSALPQVAVVEEAPNLMACWMKLACLDQAAPKRWMDAYLAALAITGGWRLLTLDRDFLGFVNDGLELQLLQSESR